MNRDFTTAQWNTLIDQSITAETNLYGFICVENFNAIYSIVRSIRAVKEHNIVPELFWHGNEDEFTWFLVLLSDMRCGYKDELIELAKTGTTGEIKGIADHFYQHICVMFDFVKRHKGYVVLKPTDYMSTTYPHTKEKLFVFTDNVWEHRDTMSFSTTPPTNR